MIIGLEGVSCVGKTTLAAALASRMDAAVVPCYYHAAPDPARLPPPTSATGGEQLSSLATLMRIEALRRTRALSAAGQGRDVILDRTVDTLLAHTHAIGCLYGFDCDAAARALVQSLPIVVPDLTLLLHGDAATLAARAARRPGLPRILYDPQFTGHFLDHFTRPLVPACVWLDAGTTPQRLVERAIAAVAAQRLPESHPCRHGQGAAA